MPGKRERLSEMIEYISTQKYASITSLATMFGVSEMTIRRDLELLEQADLIRVVRGIAFSKIDSKINGNGDAVSLHGYDLIWEVGINTVQKNNIGKFAATLIKPGDSIILDTGTTTEQIAKNIPFDVPLKVMCNNMNNLLQLKNKPKVELMVAGGLYKPNTQLFTSDNGVSYVKSFRFSRAFISAAGIDMKYGITCMEDYEVSMKKAMIESSKEHILVLDSSKFGRTEHAFFADFEDIDAIVTNQGLSDDWKDFLQSKQIELYLV